MLRRNLGFVSSVIGLLLVCGCSSEPDRSTTAAGRDKPPEAAPDAPAPPAAAKPVFEGPGKLLAEPVHGFELKGVPRYFGPKNLYDLINGGAEIYVDFGLVKMVTADYAVHGPYELMLTAEVYDMGSANGAYGRVARFLAGKNDPTDAGKGLPEVLADRGIFGTGDVVFWKDRYLVHLTLLDESPEATPQRIAAAGADLLPRFARTIADRVSDNPPPPAMLASFPADNRIARGEAWEPSKVAGIEGLGAGCTVRYADGEIQWTAFATEEHADEQAATAAWEAVKKTEAAERRVAVKLAGKRIVGVIQDQEPRLTEEALAVFTKTLLEGFGGE